MKKETHMVDYITFAELVAVVIKNLRRVLMVTLVFALLLGGYGVLQSVTATPLSDEAYETALLEYETMRYQLQYFVDTSVTNLNRQREYNSKSLLMHINLCNGMGGEVFTAELLKEAYENSTMPYEHEHVTPYMYYTNTSKGAFPYERDESAYRLTLDTPEDYEVIKLVYDALYQPGNTFTLDEMIAYLDEHPEILAINSHIQQKK